VDPRLDVDEEGAAPVEPLVAAGEPGELLGRPAGDLAERPGAVAERRLEARGEGRELAARRALRLRERGGPGGTARRIGDETHGAEPSRSIRQFRPVG
jgi:hypothetical protein